MNNIYFSLFYLLIIPISSLAGNDLAEVCKDFRANIENTDVSLADKQNDLFATGLLWKIEGPKGKINYLFGTIHSQDYAVSKLPPPVRLALVKNRTLMLETIPDDEAKQVFIDMMYFKDDQQLDNLLETVIFEELKNQIQNYGVEQEQVKFLKPWAAFSLIGRPKPVRAPTLESNLLRTAQQAMLQIKSLETMDEILSALEGLAIEDQVIILKDTICNHDQIIRDTKILIDLYIQRDLAGIVAFNNQPHYDEAVFDRFMQRILYDRNSKLLERIEKEFTTEHVFVAVGASHLAGDEGLLNKLAQDDYMISVLY